MPLAPSLPCADLAGPNCPCALGLAGECVYCTRLRGEPGCACQWAGACVLLAEPRARAGIGKPPGTGPSTAAAPAAVKVPERSAALPDVAPPGASLPAPAVRPARLALVAARSEPAPGVVDLRLQVSRRLLPLLRRPGCYLFIRTPGSGEEYNTPLTVVEAGSRELRLVLKVAGPKTAAIAAVAPGANLIWKGPHFGGLLGGTALRSAMRGGRGAAVVVARGMGQIVALPVVRALAARGWLVEAFVDPRGSGGDFGRVELEAAAGRPATVVHLETAAGAEVILAALGGQGPLTAGGAAKAPADGVAQGPAAGPRLLVSCGTDLLHAWVAAIWWKAAGQRRSGPAGPPAPPGGWGFVATNNSLMSCGEGTCGACTLRLAGGGRVRACKADIPPEMLFSPAGNTATGRARG